MPRAAPCTCAKKCRSRSGSFVFLGLFLLSLFLHAVTLVCYLDLRSEVRQEIIHQKRDSILTLAGSGDPADPAALSPGHPRLDPGRSGEGHEVKQTQQHLTAKLDRGQTKEPHTAHFNKTCFLSSLKRLFVLVRLRRVVPGVRVRLCAVISCSRATPLLVACRRAVPDQYAPRCGRNWRSLSA